jgi:hypothetical protein
MSIPFIKQEVFNTVALHLIKQGRASVAGTRIYNKPVCAYRSILDGSSCAIGCLIPDGLYHAAIEGKSAHSKDLVEILDQTFDGDYDLHLLVDLQQAHDQQLACENIHSWARRMEYLADYYKFALPAELTELLNQPVDNL